MTKEHASTQHSAASRPNSVGQGAPGKKLVTLESQREFDLFSGQAEERIFLKMYVAARTSGLLAAISDRDWKTLCVLATYMDADGFCFPSQAELARALGCSRQMANERVKSLAGFRFHEQPVLLVKKGIRADQGKWARNGYQVLPIANLDIFGESTEPASAAEPQTVSSDLDTVRAEDGTVSSQTVTVQLDTNKNHRINQIDDSSNLRKAHAQNNGTEATPPPATTARPEQPRRSKSQPESIGTTLARRHLPLPVPSYDEDRQVILSYIEDFAREFGDRAPLKSSVTRALHLYRDAGVDRETFIAALYQARAITRERSAAIRTTTGTTLGPPSAKKKFAYFMAVLADLLGRRPTTRQAPES